MLVLTKMTQEQYRKKYSQLNPNWQDSVSLYKQVINKNINKDTTLLEAGCGFSDLYKEQYRQARQVIAIDIDPDYLALNKVKLYDQVIEASIEDMPQVKDNSIDLITSAWVLEHLENPQQAIHEFIRVLKPGGKVIFLTPNKLNYIPFLNQYLLARFRNFVAYRLDPDLVVDPMPTYYRANTPGIIKKLATNVGFNSTQIIFNGDPTYMAINNFFFSLGIWMEKLLSIKFLHKFRVHIIGILHKPE